MQQFLIDFYKQISGCYEWINHLFTFGFDIRMRSYTAKKIAKEHPANYLDICCGTAELLCAVARCGKHSTNLYGIDGSLSMLGLAGKKRCAQKIYLYQAYADKIPYKDSSFDAVSISFASRNLNASKEYFKLCIQEVRRVLKPGAFFYHLETSHPNNPVVAKFFSLYVRYIVGNMGLFDAKSAQAYRFLASSTLSFYTHDELVALFQLLGLRVIDKKDWLLGGVRLIIAQRV